MSKFFIDILNNALVASWIILIVVVLRLVFEKIVRKTPKWINCLLWGLVGIRLVFPFSIESIFSLIPNAEPIPTDIEYAKIPQIDLGISTVNSVINPVLEKNFTAAEISSANPMQLVVFVLAHIWIAGVVGLLIYALVSFAILKFRVKGAESIGKRAYKCNRIESPFILGLINPRIYVPHTLSDEELACVVEHEKAHIQRGDFIWKPLGFVILAVYWFNPLCWLAYIMLCKDIEYACDEKVTKNKDKAWKAKYCQVLLDCSTQRRLVSACPVAFGEVSVKDRIKSVLNYKKPTFWIIFASVIICVIVGICFLTNPKESEPELNESKPSQMDGDSDGENKEVEQPNDSNSDVVSAYYSMIHTIETAMYNSDLISKNPDDYRDSDGNDICSSEFFAHLYDGSDDIAYQNLGYLIEDIDGDGISELLLGANDSHPSGDFNAIYDLYAYRDGKIKHLFSGWTRNRLYLTDNNGFVCEWSSSSDESGKTFYSYDKAILTEEAEMPGNISYVIPRFASMGPVWQQISDVNSDGRNDYVIYTGMDGIYSTLSLYLTGEGVVFGHNDELFIELGETTGAFDVDHDGEKEIVLSILPHVNGMPLTEFFVIKKQRMGWKELETFSTAEDNYSFPINIAHVKDYQVGISCGDLDYKYLLDTKYIRDYWEKETDIDDSYRQQILQFYDDIYSSPTGTLVGTVSPWGVWNIEIATNGNNQYLVAYQGIEGVGTNDSWGEIKIFFDYNKNGKIEIIDMQFEPVEYNTAEKIKLSEYTYDLIFNFGGNFFLSDSYNEPKHGEGTPAGWYMLGGEGKCLDPTYGERATYKEGKLTEYQWIDNHSDCEKIDTFSSGEYSCCLYKYSFDLFTASELDDAVDADSTSEYWVIFYTIGEGEPLLIKYFNCDWFTREQAMESIGN